MRRSGMAPDRRADRCRHVSADPGRRTSRRRLRRRSATSPACRAVPRFSSSPTGSLPLKYSLREGLVDHRHLRGAGAIRIGEGPSSQQRNTHRPQIARRHHAIVGLGSLAVLRRACPRKRKLVVPQKPVSGRKFVAAADFTPGSAFIFCTTSSTKARVFSWIFSRDTD